jgi:hypothetical protein
MMQVNELHIWLLNMNTKWIKRKQYNAWNLFPVSQKMDVIMHDNDGLLPLYVTLQHAYKEIIQHMFQYGGSWR